MPLYIKDSRPSWLPQPIKNAVDGLLGGPVGLPVAGLGSSVAPVTKVLSGALGGLQGALREGVSKPAAQAGTGSIFEGLDKWGRRALIDRWQTQPHNPPDVPAELLNKYIKPTP